MRAFIYVQKKEFNQFFKWVQNLKAGLYLQPPVKFWTNRETVKDYVQISLEDYEYSLVQTVTEKYEKIKNSYGDLTSEHELNSKPNHLLAIRDVLTAAEFTDSVEDVIYTALQIATEIPGLTPLEAMAIAERDCLHNIKKL